MEKVIPPQSPKDGDLSCSDECGVKAEIVIRLAQTRERMAWRQTTVGGEI